MNITQYFNPERGPTVISSAGSQRYTEKLDSFSQIYPSIYLSANNNRFAIDSCWESGNIYYADYNTGVVRKIKFDGTEIATLQLTNPSLVSVIQYDAAMSTEVSYPPQDDKGCWIADRGTGKIIKTDNQLNILYEISGVIDPVGLTTSANEGCYVADNDTENIIKLSSTATIQGIKSYSDFSPIIDTSVNPAFQEMVVDADGRIWVCANDRLYSLVFTSGSIVQQFVLYPLGTTSPSSSSSSDNLPGETMHLSSIDVDRNIADQFLYVTGGNSNNAFIFKYDFSGNLVDENLYYDISFPYIIKVSQGLNSDAIYILEDTAKWDEYEYGSSSSSSYSSSSSSSSSSSVDSSSSSSNSSSSSSSESI